MKKRILSILISLCMLICMIPSTVFATINKTYQAGDTIEFGSYPQSKVTDPETISYLNSLITDDMWVSYGYYVGTALSATNCANGEMKPSDFMKYADIYLFGEKYRAVYFSEYREHSTGLSFNSNNGHLQYENEYYKDNIYYFKYEPIKWKILDSNTGLVMADNILDSQPYNNYLLYTDGKYWSNSEKTIDPIDFEKSSLKNWLNNDFYNWAFTPRQQSKINNNNQISILSINDILNINYLYNENSRVRTFTEYSKCQGLNTNYENYKYWIYKSGSNQSYTIIKSGHITGDDIENKPPTETGYGVVPVMNIDLNTFDETVNLNYETNGGQWLSGYTPPTSYKLNETPNHPNNDNVFEYVRALLKWDLISSSGNTETYKAVWDYFYLIDFNSNGGTDIPSKYVFFNGKLLDNVDIPTKDGGYIFDYWLFGDDIINKNTKFSDVISSKNFTSSITLYANWKDIQNPVINDLIDGKTYCEKVKFTVSDNDGISTVKVGGTTISPDSEGKYTLPKGIGNVAVVATDNSGNTDTINVTVNDGHIYEWHNENSEYWQKCRYCNNELSRSAIPIVTINGNENVCKTQDYNFDFTISENCKNPTYGYEVNGVKNEGLSPTLDNGTYKATIPAKVYNGSNNLKVIVTAETADGFKFTTTKDVTILDNHQGGTANCTEKATCSVCDEKYGDLDPNNHTGTEEWTSTPTNHEKKYSCCGAVTVPSTEHTWNDGKCTVCSYDCIHQGGTANCTEKATCEICDMSYGEIDSDNHKKLKHIEAVSVTNEAEGNIEYWYCEDCGKYFSDKNCTTEITKEDTVIEKLDDDSLDNTKPTDDNNTNDNSNSNSTSDEAESPSSGNETKSPLTGDNALLAFALSLLFATSTVFIGKKTLSNKKNKK